MPNSGAMNDVKLQIVHSQSPSRKLFLKDYTFYLSVTNIGVKHIRALPSREGEYGGEMSISFNVPSAPSSSSDSCV